MNYIGAITCPVAWAPAYHDRLARERMAVCDADAHSDDNGSMHPRLRCVQDPLAQLARYEDLLATVQTLLDLDAIEHPEDLQRWADRWGAVLHIKPAKARDCV